MTHVAREAVAERYGTERSRRLDRRVGWIVAGAAVLGGAAVLVFGNWYTNTTGFQDLGFTTGEVSSTGVHTASTRFEVTSEPGARVSCAIEAMNTSKATVGWKIVDLPVSESRHQTVTVDLVTIGHATAAYAKSCWAVEG